MRSGEQGAGISFGAFAGDLDGDGTIDLALASFDPIAPDGTLPESVYASEVYLDLGR